MKSLAELHSAVQVALVNFNSWLNSALPYPNGPTYFAASRMVEFFCLAFLAYSLVRLWIHRPRLWEAWLVTPFVTLSLGYFGVKLFVTATFQSSGSYGLLILNLSTAGILFSVSLLIRLLTGVTLENSLLAKRVRRQSRILSALRIRRKPDK